MCLASCYLLNAENARRWTILVPESTSVPEAVPSAVAAVAVPDLECSCGAHVTSCGRITPHTSPAERRSFGPESEPSRLRHDMGVGAAHHSEEPATPTSWQEWPCALGGKAVLASGIPAPAAPPGLRGCAGDTHLPLEMHVLTNARPSCRDLIRAFRFHDTS